ncbi:transmembrane protein 104 homolog isoform X2 [Dermatophagoides pteronyssinus]|uniref:transmembrane protein 104 homolog isoform X2 n=1 Tax=Dermatophagoides pteronyssinus TaxID=6956 RepID=UPI003F67C049
MADNNNLYSALVGSIYLFNLLLGTGVLAMPAVFANAGYLSGILCLAILCLISYVQTTFLIETMANANFIKRMTKKSNESDIRQLCSTTSINTITTTTTTNDNDNLQWNNIVCSDLIRNNNNRKEKKQRNIITNNIINCLQSIDHLDKRFNINEKFELGNMTELFLNQYLSKIFFISVIVYLFGDIVIYNSMMSKSLRDISCTSKAYCDSSDSNDPEHLNAICWDSITTITRKNAYQIFLLGFVAILGPLTYAQLQKTKIIQILTIILRWLAFASMIGITIKIFISKQANGQPKAFNLLNLPKLFGICVYSFMCHHSVPSILTPIRNKKNLLMAVSIDYILVFAFYIIIAFTAVFAFDDINQVYTLNFQIDKCSHNNSNPASVPGFEIFLPTFPIFTLFSSYTILALTLINNMKVLVGFSNIIRYNCLIKYSMPLIAIIPPLLIALFTEDVSSIIQFVGSYSGTMIQYVFPTLLVYYSRKQVQQKFLLPYIKNRTKCEWIDERTINMEKIYETLNSSVSYFRTNFWIYFTAIWWIICICLVTLDHLRDAFHLY